MFVENKEQGEAAPVKVGTLKLSEAIRIGSSLRPQTKTGECGPFSHGRSCALGAAFEAIGGQYSETMPTTSVCEVLEGRGMLPKWNNSVVSGIITKNDFSGWSRERIADWLESQGL